MYNPPLSIVATGRNDEHGGNQLQRTQSFVSGIFHQSRKFDLDLELILVEWNPLPDRPRLVEALTWPDDPGPCNVRIIEVPPEVHNRFRHSEKLPLFQMIGKNVGIRRSLGRFVLATNIDIIFSDEMIRYLASGRLKKEYYYRANRYDVSQDIPQDISQEDFFSYCQANTFRISNREGIHNLKDGDFFRIFQPMNWRLRVQELKQDWGLAKVTNPSLLFTNACGDFTLMAREHWFNLCGYPELERYSFHIDSLLLHAAYHYGLREKTLQDPMKIYHLDHTAGSGFTPEHRRELDQRLALKGIPRISDQELHEWTLRMRHEQRPMIFSDENWGLAGEALPETTVYKKVESGSNKVGKRFFNNYAQTAISPSTQVSSPVNAAYLVVDPKSKVSENPLVSVVVPTLNRAEYLVPTLVSILQQDYPNIECIVVDGGSTDRTIQILESYGDRIKWISEPDESHAEAIAKGWRMGKGEILAWLNADDIWEIPGAVSRVVEYFKAHQEVSLVYGNCGRIDADGELIGMSYIHEWDLVYAVERFDHCIPQPAAFIRRSILEKVGWLDTNFHQKKDHELWLRIGLNGVIRHIPVLLAHARKIKGLSDDGKSMAKSCTQVTRKFFSLPNVPSPIRRKKRRALSNTYLRAIDYAFIGGRHWEIIFKYGLYAALIHPLNAIKVCHYLRRIFAEGAVAGIHDRRRIARMGWIMVSLVLEFLEAFGPYGIIGRFCWRIKWFLTGHGGPRIPNLLGDRDIEWSWIASQMPTGYGKALDFGSGSSHMALIAALKGYDVTAVDLQEVKFPYIHTQFNFIRGEYMSVSLPSEHFDLVINCSTIEHIGLAGRFGVLKDLPDGDLEAMARLRDQMKPGAVMLLTIPVGKDKVFPPLCRVYGENRLPMLLRGFKVKKEIYWVKDFQNRWTPSQKETALHSEPVVTSWNPLRNIYALGCFVLKKE